MWVWVWVWVWVRGCVGVWVLGVVGCVGVWACGGFAGDWLVGCSSGGLCTRAVFRPSLIAA